MGKGSLCWRGITESPPLGVTPGTQATTVQEGRGTEAKRGGMEGQVRAEEVGLDHGAVTDSEALEDLDHGAVADSGTLEDLGCGAVADSGTLEDLGRGAVADSGTLEDLGRGALEQKSTIFDSEEPGTMAGQAEQAEQEAMAGQAEQGAMAGQTGQAEQGAMAGQTEQAEQTEQTGAKIPTVEQMTSIAEQRAESSKEDAAPLEGSAAGAATSGGIGADSSSDDTSGTDSWSVVAEVLQHMLTPQEALAQTRGQDPRTNEASGADMWSNEASGADLWPDEASGADSWSDEASGEQCVAHTLKMAITMTSSTEDSVMPAGLQGVEAVGLESMGSAWLGSVAKT
ncbi:hypothetical protein M9458_051519 [Cirrhinus mrigala]|uniref:Uncharacterized protein n=1 Tax=Cirrhinus mrigala TaxID=683832 RepID=A0ABD0MWJ7_CIRMR